MGPSSGWERGPFSHQDRSLCTGAGCVLPAEPIWANSSQSEAKRALMFVQDRHLVTMLCPPTWAWKMTWGLWHPTLMRRRTKEKMRPDILILISSNKLGPCCCFLYSYHCAKAQRAERVNPLATPTLGELPGSGHSVTKPRA